MFFATNALLLMTICELEYIKVVSSVWEGARHGDYASFRFQMSHKKMPDGDYVQLHF